MRNILKSIVQFYLRLFTRIALWRHRPFVIAVAGSTNKTPTKEYILKFLREKYGEHEVRGNPRSYNTEIGLPLAILYLESGESSPWKWLKILVSAKWKAFFERKFPKKLVLELGVDRKGDMKYLLGIVTPQIAVITNIEGNYSDADNNLEQIFEEFKVLVGSIPTDGTVVLNHDDERVALLQQEAKAKVITYGFSEKADAKITDLKTGIEGQNFEFSFRGQNEKVEIKKYGRHFVYAWAIAKIIKSIL